MDAAVEIKREPISVQKGPIEGIILVNGRPQMERSDMPTISFESIQALMKLKDSDM